MSFLKNILGAFVELKEEPSAADKADSKPDSTKNIADNLTAVPASATQAVPSTSANSSAVQPDFKKHFEELIEEANAKNPLFQGTDFKEFIESKSDLDAIADETAKYKTAFNVLKRTGLTKERLVNTGQEYINIIDKDLSAFENAFNQQYKADVVQKEQLLQHKAQELQVLTEKISNLNNEIKQMSQEVIKTKDKLNTNKNCFLLAGEEKKKEIRTELQKIDQYFS